MGHIGCRKLRVTIGMDRMDIGWDFFWKSVRSFASSYIFKGVTCNMAFLKATQLMVLLSGLWKLKICILYRKNRASINCPKWLLHAMLNIGKSIINMRFLDLNLDFHTFLNVAFDFLESPLLPLWLWFTIIKSIWCICCLLLSLLVKSVMTSH